MVLAGVQRVVVERVGGCETALDSDELARIALEADEEQPGVDSG